MDFFGRAEAARGRSRLYTLLFFLASACTVASVGLVTWGVWELRRRYWLPTHADAVDFQATPLVLGAIIVTALLILVAIIEKTVALSSGGAAIAGLLGGTLVAPSERDPPRRQLLNVLEEMSIAAGLPVPALYVLEREDGINAFAAGLSQGDAVVGVTRGALANLTRDELQGVVGHELSHILNGDMALNMQLAIQQHGLMCLMRFGQWLAAAPFRDERDESSSSRSQSQSQSNDRNVGAELIAAAIGFLVMVVGAIGSLFGSVFMSAVSRQRELLADASAVQFTRNPVAVANVLKKIAAMPYGSHLDNPRRAEAGHFFFAAVDRGFATHPLLYDRIVAIEPEFDGTLPELHPHAVARAEAPKPPATVRVPAPLARSVAAAVPFVERPFLARLDHAELVLGALPPALAAAARDPGDARAVVTAQLLDDEPDVRSRQLEALASAGDPGLAEAVSRIEPAVRACPVEAWLPLAQLCAPALRRLSVPQYRAWRRVVFRLVDASPRLTLFQFALHRSVFRRLESSFAAGVEARAAPAARPLASLAGACAVLLSGLAWANDAREAAARAAFAAGAAALGSAGTGLALVGRDGCSLPLLDPALDQLAATSGAGKQLVVTACRAVVLYDGKVTLDELELVRAFAATLDCPLPLLA